MRRHVWLFGTEFEKTTFRNRMRSLVFSCQYTHLASCLYSRHETSFVLSRKEPNNTFYEMSGAYLREIMLIYLVFFTETVVHHDTRGHCGPLRTKDDELG